MGWRFRRSFKVAPGIRLNVGKTGVTSVSVGGRGARVTFGKRGVRQTVSLPGTGLSFSQSLSSSRPRPSRASADDTPLVAENPSQRPYIDPARFGISPQAVPLAAGRLKLATIAVGVVLLLIAMISPNGLVVASGLLCVIVGMTMSSRKAVVEREAARCQEMAWRELDSRLEQLRAALQTDVTGHAAKKLQALLGLADEEIGAPTVQAIDAAIALKTFEQSVVENDNQLIAVAAVPAIVPAPCYFTSACTFDKRGDNDPTGSLYLTSEGATFIAEHGRTDVRWKSVSHVAREHATLMVQRKDRQTPTRFDLPDLGTGLIAEFISRRLWGSPVDPVRQLAATAISKTSANRVLPEPDRASDSTTYLAVVGESHYQEALRALRQELLEVADGSDEFRFTAVLKPEPENQHDPNAIVVLGPQQQPLGYVAARIAKEFHRRLSAVGMQSCTAELRGGTGEKRSIGVVLHWGEVRERLIAVDGSMRHGQEYSNVAEPPDIPGETALFETARAAGLDAHGQPLNRGYNVARRRARDVSEMLGLVKGMLADGAVTVEEVRFIREWFLNHPDALVTWPHRVIHERLEHIFSDGQVDDTERADLAALLSSLVGGSESILLGYDGASQLPLDVPPPMLTWHDQVYVFTGRFAYGTRKQCEREVTQRKGTVDDNVTKKTTVLVIGTFGNEDWIHSSYGRKIQKAVELRDAGAPIHIVGEDHWVNELEPSATTSVIPMGGRTI
ncbi:MAG: DUF4236 domain-containing protein [Vicinamibacterales bacterium]